MTKVILHSKNLLYLCKMRRVLGFVLLFSFLSSITELHEVFKLPELLKHFATHQSKSPDLTFIEFLGIHYSSEEESKSRTEHENLPFKSQDEFCHMPVIKALPADVKLLIKEVFTSLLSNLPADEQFISRDISSIWQPPKIV